MPLSDCEVRDPRIRRTRQLLQDALSRLLRAKAFDEITVQDITEAATVNRATFYDHYADKFALFESLVAGGFHKLLHERAVHFEGGCPAAASSIILATCDYLALTRADPGECERQSAFESMADAAIVAAIRRVLAEGMARRGQQEAQFGAGSELVEPGAVEEMRTTTAAWAIFGAVKQWFVTPHRSPVEQAVPMVLAVVTPLLLSSPEPAKAGQPSVAST